MKAFVGVTDNDWFRFLSELPEIDEVNFWQPSATQRFQALNAGEPFLFKLHSPHNYIVGGGFFAHSALLPISLAWEVFGEKNGAGSFLEMRGLIEKRRPSESLSTGDYHIGCILLGQPFFFLQDQWIPVPEDWSPNIVRGKGYDLTTGFGKKLWEEVQLRLQGRIDLEKQIREGAEEGPHYGKPIVVAPRLGQGSFRIIVTDTYQRRCAVTNERTLPALEAVHIKPFSDSGPHMVQNGILFRADIHKLFDTGYATISPDYRFEVSRRIRDEFENGGDYYAMHGRRLHLPVQEKLRPANEFITLHNENIFRG
ncbi:MAG: HNH endonuclease [Desulfobacterales bacterium]|nr:HNH endonuclease [Desulfobacterales bacterium]